MMLMIDHAVNDTSCC